ncbi:MAG: DUF6597 domain-containing transcriptional factor [Cyclobacteriaceae bacterium]|jgi:AraC-like DNA-binding protein
MAAAPMHYRKFSPHPDLAPWVECVYEWQGIAEAAQDIQTSPSAFAALVINEGADYSVYQHRTPPAVVPDAFVCGLFTSNYHLVLNGPIQMMGVVFKPWGFHNFFGTRMSSLVNSRLDLDLFLPGEGAMLAQAVRMEAEPEAKARVLQDFLLGRLAEAKARVNVIDDAAQLMELKNGGITIAEVAEHFHISKRYVEKQFLAKVGVSPKFYARIKRFSFLMVELIYRKNQDWQALVEKTGLHDQSHLIKEFLEFNQANPEHYLNSHNEMARFVEKISWGKTN